MNQIKNNFKNMYNIKKIIEIKTIIEWQVTKILKIKMLKID